MARWILRPGIKLLVLSDVERVRNCQQFSSIQLISFAANDAAQMSCMKAVPSKKLEDAVISTNSAFRLQTDSEYFRY